MDEITTYNTLRWKALADADALFTRPLLSLDEAGARARLDPDGWLGRLAGKRVLLVAGGGGQQSALFAVLGARVTVTDLSEEQLARDRMVAEHYGITVETVQTDMRDLSAFPETAFDIVWQPYSINFVPDPLPVFAQVARVIRPGGIYQVQCANPFSSGLTERDWNGDGYVLRRPYVDGAPVTYQDAEWVYERTERSSANPIPPPREYRHTLATVLNGLLERGFVIEHVSDRRSQHPDPNAEPGTWNHFVAFCPPWLNFWTRYRPAMLGTEAERD